VARKAHRQALRSELERLKLRGCALPAAFVLRDLMGTGALQAQAVPTGTLLRLVDLD